MNTPSAPVSEQAVKLADEAKRIAHVPDIQEYLKLSALIDQLAALAQAAAPVAAAVSDEHRKGMMKLADRIEAADEQPMLIGRYAAPILRALASPAAAAQPAEPAAEIFLFGGDHKEVSWRNGKMPPVGTKLYASAVAATSAPPQPAYPLPDDLYESKDWRQGDYAARVEWLHAMYEARKADVELLLDALQPAEADALPELPPKRFIKGEAGRNSVRWGEGFDADDMRAYARAALATRAKEPSAVSEDVEFERQQKRGAMLLMVELWRAVPEAREMIERRTGQFFALGHIRDAWEWRDSAAVAAHDAMHPTLPAPSAAKVEGDQR